MAEKSNEELLDELISASSVALDNDAPDGAWADVERLKAAVRARMCGPGEVVVPVKPTPAMRDAMRLASRRDVPSDEMCDVRYAALLAARPNNGGADDQGK